ncbi:hypothetical protein H4S00_002312, partial [Coemansia sp. D1744]
MGIYFDSKLVAQPNTGTRASKRPRVEETGLVRADPSRATSPSLPVGFSQPPPGFEARFN